MDSIAIALEQTIRSYFAYTYMTNDNNFEEMPLLKKAYDEFVSQRDVTEPDLEDAVEGLEQSMKDFFDSWTSMNKDIRKFLETPMIQCAFGAYLTHYSTADQQRSILSSFVSKSADESRNISVPESSISDSNVSNQKKGVSSSSSSNNSDFEYIEEFEPVHTSSRPQSRAGIIEHIRRFEQQMSEDEKQESLNETPELRLNTMSMNDSVTTAVEADSLDLEAFKTSENMGFEEIAAHDLNESTTTALDITSQTAVDAEEVIEAITISSIEDLNESTATAVEDLETNTMAAIEEVENEKNAVDSVEKDELETSTMTAVDAETSFIFDTHEMNEIEVADFFKNQLDSVNELPLNVRSEFINALVVKMRASWNL